jgi:hypothetical protein
MPKSNMNGSTAPAAQRIAAIYARVSTLTRLTGDTAYQPKQKPA